MAIKITKPLSNAQVSGIITLTVQSTQKVDGMEADAQTFSVTRDLRGKTGPQSLSVKNSAGETASITVNATANAPLTAAALNPVPVSLIGANGHFWPWSTPYTNDDLTIAKLSDLGVGGYRVGYGANDFGRYQSFITKAAPKGISLFPVLMCDPGTTESASYNNGYALGVECAKNLKQYLTAYEVGNEEAAGTLLGNVDGTDPKHFDNAKFQLKRGKILGMIAGIRSQHSNAFIVLGAETWLHFGFFDMLMQGTQPDGSTGHPIPDVNALAWHWYSDMGDIEAARGGGGPYNVLQHLAGYGKPLWLTEVGARSYNFTTDSAAADYLVGPLCLAKYVAVAKKYNVQHVSIYELFNDGRTTGQAGSEGKYGLCNYDLSNKAQYTAVKAFVAAHK